MTITTTPVSLVKPAAHVEGARVRVTDRNVPHLANSRYLNAEGVIAQVTAVGDFRVTFDNADLNYGGGTWTEGALQIIQAAPSGRPTIDFSDANKDRSKAREYAAAADSRILPLTARAALQRAANGEQVDAYDLNAALTQAMSAAATRHGQSMGRRDLTKKIRHLAYIVEGVLENHANGLPVYDGGPRSPRIAELELEVEHAGIVNQSLAADLTASRESFRGLKASANEEVSRLLDIASKRDALLAETVKDRDEVATVLAYVMDALDDASKQRVFGFWDGITS